METWKKIEWADGNTAYYVSDLGRVKSIRLVFRYKPGGKKKIKGSQHEKVTYLSPVEREGYLGVQLWTKTDHKYAAVARLVAAAFIPNPDNKPEVNHEDGNTLNNRKENLTWVTSSENKRHAFDTGLAVNPAGTKSNSAILSVELLKKIRELADKGYKSARIARLLGIPDYTVARVRKGKTYSEEWQMVTYGKL